MSERAIWDTVAEGMEVSRSRYAGKVNIAMVVDWVTTHIDTAADANLIARMVITRLTQAKSPSGVSLEEFGTPEHQRMLDDAQSAFERMGFMPSYRRKAER